MLPQTITSPAQTPPNGFQLDHCCYCSHNLFYSVSFLVGDCHKSISSNSEGLDLSFAQFLIFVYFPPSCDLVWSSLLSCFDLLLSETCCNNKNFTLVEIPQKINLFFHPFQRLCALIHNEYYNALL